MVKKASEIFEDGPSANPSRPSKPDLRAWGTWLESFLTSIGANSGSVFPTRAALFADLAHAANSMAWVMSDGTVAYNGIYRKSGASGAGAWVRIGDLPYSFIAASNSGAGTANAIQADTTVPVSESALVVLPIVATNTASPTSVSFNGGAALTIKSAVGNNIAIGGQAAGMRMLGIVSGGAFRLVTDQVSSAIIAAAEAEATKASGFASLASRFANAPENEEVTPGSGLYSCFHFFKKMMAIADGELGGFLQKAGGLLTGDVLFGPGSEGKKSKLQANGDVQLNRGDNTGYNTWNVANAYFGWDGTRYAFGPAGPIALSSYAQVDDVGGLSAQYYATGDIKFSGYMATDFGGYLSTALRNAKSGLGVGQTWQNVSASRSAGTVYQNTSGKPIIVAPQGWARYSFCEGQVSADNSNWFTPPRPEKIVNSDTTYYYAYPMFVVPPGHYYRLTQGNNFLGTVAWLELR